MNTDLLIERMKLYGNDKKLGKLLGKSASTIERMKKDPSKITCDQIEILCKELGLDIKHVLDFKHPVEIPDFNEQKHKHALTECEREIIQADTVNDGITLIDFFRCSTGSLKPVFNEIRAKTEMEKNRPSPFRGKTIGEYFNCIPPKIIKEKKYLIDLEVTNSRSLIYTPSPCEVNMIKFDNVSGDRELAEFFGVDTKTIKGVRKRKQFDTEYCCLPPLRRSKNDSR